LKKEGTASGVRNRGRGGLPEKRESPTFHMRKKKLPSASGRRGGKGAYPLSRGKNLVVEVKELKKITSVGQGEEQTHGGKDLYQTTRGSERKRRTLSVDRKEFTKIPRKRKGSGGDRERLRTK